MEGMEGINWLEIIGQGFGMIAVAFGFLSYQMRTQKQLLAMQLATAVVFCIHYALIGATSGLLCNVIAAARNLAYYHRDKPLFSGKRCPIIFAVLMGLSGVVSWQGYASLFVIVGLVINTLCLSLTDPQKIRKSILVTSPLVLCYNAIVFSLGGMIYESVCIVSSVIGMLRFKREKNAA